MPLGFFSSVKTDFTTISYESGQAKQADDNRDTSASSEAEFVVGICQRGEVAIKDFFLLKFVLFAVFLLSTVAHVAVTHTARTACPVFLSKIYPHMLHPLVSRNILNRKKGLGVPLLTSKSHTRGMVHHADLVS